MMHHSYRWLKRFQTFLNLEILEDRNPVSEGLSTLLSMAGLAAAGRALARTVQPPPLNHLSQFARSMVVTSAVPSSSNFSPERGTSAPSFRSTSPVPTPVPARPSANPLPDPVGRDSDLFSNGDIALTDSPAAAPRGSAGSGSGLEALPTSFPAGADFGQQPVAAPDGGLRDRGSAANATEVTPISGNSQPDAATLALMLGAGLGATSHPTQAPTGGDVLGGSSGGPLVNSHHHGRPSDKAGDPLWVLDANDRIVLPDASTVPVGYAINTFSGWSMNLFVQVSGATVQSYSWTLTGSDFASHGSLTSYNLQFTWASFSGNNRSDTVSLTTTNVGGGGETQTFHFNVISTSNPANQGSRPTSTPTFSLLIPPNAVKSGQEMIDQQYYSLSIGNGRSPHQLHLAELQ